MEHTANLTHKYMELDRHQITSCFMAPEAFLQPHIQETVISALSNDCQPSHSSLRAKLFVLSGWEGWSYSLSPVNQSDANV